MRSSHTVGSVSARFDDDSLVSCAGLVPVMRLAEMKTMRELPCGAGDGPGLDWREVAPACVAIGHSGGLPGKAETIRPRQAQKFSDAVMKVRKLACCGTTT
jgi:hypothetical protein